jgi:hypothetical protein
MNKAFYAATTLVLALVLMGCPDDEEPPPTGFGDSSSEPTPVTDTPVTPSDDVPTTDPTEDTVGDVTDPGPDGTEELDQTTEPGR